MTRSTARPQQHGPKRVLVFEPDALLRLLLTEALTCEGFRVQSVQHAAAALARLGQQPPAVLLVHLAEPDAAGWTFLERCRQQPGCQALPIAVLSTTLAQHAAAAAVRARGYGWIPKPFRLGHLAAILDDLAQRSASRVLCRVHQQHAVDVLQHLHGAAVTRSWWCRADCPAGASERTEQHAHPQRARPATPGPPGW